MEKELNINDSYFIKSINEGNKEVFKVLFELYYAKLLHVAHNYISNKEDAEEIVQDVFLKAWKKRNRITSNINGYLFKITKNSCLDYLKSKKRKLNRFGLLVQLEAFVNHDALADNDSILIIEKELEQKIQLGIDLLPEKCKKVFIKSRIEGLKNKEISKVLDISEKTVENHMTKALRHMRVHLRDFLSLF